VRDLHPASPDVDRGRCHGVEAEGVDPGEHADDVDERVHAAEFVQVHAFEGDSVDLGFDLCEAAEHGGSTLAHARRDAALG
jgi:hypothetical protein